MAKLVDIADLEEYWRDLRAPTVEVSSRNTQLEGLLDQASVATVADLRAFLSTPEAYGRGGTNELILQMSARAARIFMSHWYEAHKKQDIGILIEIILEGQDAPVEEVKGFVRALPRSIINRILGELKGQATGLHALFSVEAHWRDGTLEEDFTIRKGMDGKIVVSFHPKESPEPLSFVLSNLFQGPNP